MSAICDGGGEVSSTACWQEKEKRGQQAAGSRWHRKEGRRVASSGKQALGWSLERMMMRRGVASGESESE